MRGIIIEEKSRKALLTDFENLAFIFSQLWSTWNLNKSSVFAILFLQFEMKPRNPWIRNLRKKGINSTLHLDKTSCTMIAPIVVLKYICKYLMLENTDKERQLES